MVDKNSLRIGNILAWKDDESDNNLIRVSAICDDVVFVVMKLAGDDEETDCGYNAVRYVSLSPELLIKCGLKEGMKNYWELTDGWFYVYHNNIENTFQLNVNCEYFVDVEIKYLHQLQNLYFALTNTELNIQL